MGNDARETHVVMPKWLVNIAIAVMAILLVLAIANLSLNFLDSRARARFDAILEERAVKLESIERRLDTLERK